MVPLAGITVVALEQVVAAPFATRQLADLGARVIKVERPGTGDFARYYDETVRGMSSYFVWLNRSKESLSLNLKHPEAPRIMQGLLAQADVFVQNLSPGAAEQLGLDAESLRTEHTRLITCSISGYGTSGPYRDKRAYDLLVQCEAGVVSVTGSPDAPAKSGVSVADIAAGMYAFSGILTALYQRERTGQGATLDVSLFEALGEWMGYQAYFAAYGGSEPPRAGASHATITPYGPFQCGDGHEVYLAVQNEREWERFCTLVLERPELVADPRFTTNSVRMANRDALRDLIHAAFAQFTTADVVARLDQARIANGQMNTVREFWDHPQLAARDRWRNVNSPVGPLRALIPPTMPDGMEPRMDPIPSVGEHTETILAALGYSAEQIARLREDGAI